MMLHTNNQLEYLTALRRPVLLHLRNCSRVLGGGTIGNMYLYIRKGMSRTCDGGTSDNTWFLL